MSFYRLQYFVVYYMKRFEEGNVLLSRLLPLTVKSHRASGRKECELEKKINRGVELSDGYEARGNKRRIKV